MAVATRMIRTSNLDGVRQYVQWGGREVQTLCGLNLYRSRSPVSAGLTPGRRTMTRRPRCARVDPGDANRLTASSQTVPAAGGGGIRPEHRGCTAAGSAGWRRSAGVGGQAQDGVHGYLNIEYECSGPALDRPIREIATPAPRRELKRLLPKRLTNGVNWCNVISASDFDLRGGRQPNTTTIRRRRGDANADRTLPSRPVHRTTRRVRPGRRSWNRQGGAVKVSNHLSIKRVRRRRVRGSGVDTSIRRGDEAASSRRGDRGDGGTSALSSPNQLERSRHPRALSGLPVRETIRQHDMDHRARARANRHPLPLPPAFGGGGIGGSGQTRSAPRRPPATGPGMNARWLSIRHVLSTRGVIKPELLNQPIRWRTASQHRWFYRGRLPDGLCRSADPVPGYNRSTCRNGD